VTILENISASLQEGRAKDVKELVQQAIDQGIGAQTILEEGLLAGMNVVGEKFRVGEVFVPEVMIAARAMNTGMALLKPLLTGAGVEATGKVVIGTVKGDLHDIGKNLVRMMMQGKGLEVIDLGADVSAEKFIQAINDHHADILALSAMLTTTMHEMKVVIEALKQAGIRDKVKVMVGGAPITEGFRATIGADAYGVDATSASERAVALIGRAGTAPS
jgi:corrinoid protein of di/trimethylamine methyltransferase